MGRFIWVCFVGIWGIFYGFFSVAQSPVTLFEPLTWEQASMIASRENKLVLVEVGKVDAKTEGRILKQQELVHYLSRHVVALKIDMDSPQGKLFQSRLVMYPYPAFAFFMPYADLLVFVSPEEVQKDPQVLRVKLEDALKRAEVKKKNSRAINFSNVPFQTALEEIAGSPKLLFMELYRDSCQACLLMDKDVFNLDRVADFFNRNFVSLKWSEKYAEDLIKQYAIQEYPAYLFLNAEGKLVHQAGGYAEAEQLIQYGEIALKKAKGIPFQGLTVKEALLNAQQQGKFVFVDYYIPGTAHKKLQNMVFADPEVTDFFAKYFINVSVESDRALLSFLDASGNELHRLAGITDAALLLEEGRRILQGKSKRELEISYRQGRRDSAFVMDYIKVLHRADDTDKASEVAMEYLSAFSPDGLLQSDFWKIFDQYVLRANSVFFDYLLAHRERFYQLYGEKEVQAKLAALWIAGAENFVKNGVFDEEGFKAYSKRLKKEKVDGWQQIVRNARMHAAEQVGDWKTFVVLAEEKWNEERISDAELYQWGLKIEQNCQDESIRYRAARWFALAAVEMEKRERVSGKVKLNSYKGFYEKLVDDLLKK